MDPRISIITPSFQQQEYLRACLASVHEQGYAGLEHIVVDGGSTDGSRAIIEAASDRLAWWCSEADRGQSHAINKGLEQATGEVFGWLNSDDLLLPRALDLVGAAFRNDPKLLIFGGQRIYRGSDGTDRLSTLDRADDTEGLFLHPQVNQQSTFYRMDTIRKVGGVEEALHYTMDLELWWQALFMEEHGTFRFDHAALAVFRLHDHAKTSTGGDAFRNETAIILHHMAVQLDQHDLAIVLEMGYDVERALRPMPIEARHIPIVRRMVAYFLLKWHHTIHRKQEFDMMREFIRVGVRMDHIEPEQRKQWKVLQTHLQVPGWLAFRIKRKFEHLLA